MDTTLLAPHVDSHPEKCGGKPCVTGTRVRVWDVAHHIERLGETPDEVIRAYPHLSLADVYGAMAYYWDHREEIEQQMRQADERVLAWIKEHGTGPLGEKLFGQEPDESCEQGPAQRRGPDLGVSLMQGGVAEGAPS